MKEKEAKRKPQKRLNGDYHAKMENFSLQKAIFDILS